jgi:spermidine synthase
MSDSTAPRHAKPFVYLTSKTKALHFSISEIQSRMELSQPDALNLEYTRTMMGFLLFDAAPERVGMVGLGGGSLAKFCYRQLATAKISVAEINPYVIALRDEFSVPPDGERFSVIQADGADFVRAFPEQFNVLLIDGYDSKGLPRALSSQRFYVDCFRALAPNGIMAVNLHSDHSGYEQHIDRIKRSFDGAVLLVEDRREGNSIVFARKGQPLSALSVGPLRRPPFFDEGTWKSFQGPFARILSALKENTR